MRVDVKTDPDGRGKATGGAPAARDRTALAARLIAAATLALVFAPYIWGYLNAPPGMVFMGFADHPYDQNVYLSYIQQAAEGKLHTCRDHTLEPQARAWFNPFTLILGRAARITGATPLQVYYAAIALYAFSSCASSIGSPRSSPRTGARASSPSRSAPSRRASAG